MDRSPTMTVTILQAGIARAPRHRKYLGDAVRNAPPRHELLLRSAVSAAGGTVVETDSDTLCAAFPDPADAVSAALAIQRALHSGGSAEIDTFRVCIVLHTGPVTNKDDRFAGATVEHAERLLGAGHAGQVLISEATYLNVRESLPEGCSIRNLGNHRVKTLDQPEPVYQLLSTELPDDFPPLIAVDSQSPPGHYDLAQLPFVGRDAELYSLGRALDQVLTGAGQVSLLAGEPGIGKTRTAERLASIARDRGAHVLWGNCFEWEQAPAYWPWTQVLRAWLREAEAETLQSLPGVHATLVSHILPEIQDRLPDLPPPPVTDPEARLFQLLVAIGSLFRHTTAQQPLVVVLDDIHWADTPSLQLLRFMAQEIRDTRLLLIATYRDTEIDRQHPASPILAEIIRAPHCHRFLLKGLPKPQVARFVALVTGEAQPPPLVDAVHGETEGNPFFVTEVVRLLIDDGQIGDESGSVPYRRRVPESVSETVARRLERLSTECCDALEVASVVGREFDVLVLEKATGRTAPDLLDALDEAAHAQLILPGETPATYRFTHALVQDTVYHELSNSVRARLHLAVGGALELTAGNDSRWAEIARHYYLAGPLADPSKVVTYSEKAGNAAMEKFAWESATAHYDRAVSLLPQVGETQPVRRCDLLLALGEAQNRSGSGAGDVPAARASFLEAFELARQLGDAERMARAAVGFAGMNMVAVFGGHLQFELLEEALAAMDPVDSPLRVRVLARLAVDLWHRSSKNLERVRALSDAAVSMATRLDDPTLIGYALWARHSSGHRPDNLEERVIDSTQLAGLAEQSGDPLIATWGYLLQVCDSIEVGEFSVAEQALDRLHQFDDQVRIPYLAQRVAAFDAALGLMKGHYDTAAAGIERARTLWQSSAPRQHQFQPFLLLRDLGQLSQMTEEIRLPDHLHPWRHAAQVHRMALALENGYVVEARADYEALVADDFNRVRFDRHWFVSAVMLADAIVAFEDTSRAEMLITMMEPYADRIAIDGSLVIPHGPIALYLGRMATLLRRWDDARHWLGQSLEISERLGLRPYVARTLLAHAEFLVGRGGRGDLAAAFEKADDALEMANAIGMQGLVPRISTLRNAIPEQTGKPFGLTPRELEVLGLVARGMTDAEVGEHLFLSRRTISTHLTSIYGKLNVSSRAAATRRALEHGLN